jgi:hypothetical protein
LKLVVEHAATLLVSLDTSKEGSEVSLAKTQVILSLNELEKNGPNQIFGEELQQVSILVAVDEHISALNLLAILGHRRKSFEQCLIVVGLDVEELKRAPFKLAKGCKNVIGQQGDVLNARASIFFEIFVDLRFLLVGLIDGNAKSATRRAQRERSQTRLCTTNVEISNLLKAEDRLIEMSPVFQGSFFDIVREVVDGEEPFA